MDMYPRICNILKTQSFFLLGPRGTGKSTYLKYLFSDSNVLWFDFLKSADEERFSENPDLLFDIVTTAKQTYDWVVIDEVQKVPKILDIIHRIIESKVVNTKFALTGSSARKLKRGSANMLAGRAFSHHLFPFSYQELGSSFDLQKAINFGMLPVIWNYSNEVTQEEEIKAYLRSYVELYVKEEVWIEQLIKNLPPFRKFLEVAAQMSGEIINYSKIAKQIRCDVKTVQNYFLILEDTLMSFSLEAYHTSVRKRLISSPKFYFFDLGVKRALERTLNLQLLPSSFTYGKNFEEFIITQIIFLNEYKKLDYRFFYLKTKDGAEIDLIIERPGKALVLIEIKSSTNVDDSDISTLLEFKKSLPSAQCYCLSLDLIDRTKKDVRIVFWTNGLKELGF